MPDGSPEHPSLSPEIRNLGDSVRIWTQPLAVSQCRCGVLAYWEDKHLTADAVVQQRLAEAKVP